jgi:TonB family protein
MLFGAFAMSIQQQAPDAPTEHSGEDRDLLVNPAVPAVLYAAVLESVKAPPRRGLEVGGLLLGSGSSGSRIEAIQAVAIEYRFGPSFDLSYADLELVRQIIDELSRQPEVRVLGHYRSQTGGPLEVSPLDHALALLTGMAEPLTLLVSAAPTGPFPSRLFRRQGSQFTELAEFPLSLGFEAPALPLVKILPATEEPRREPVEALPLTAAEPLETPAVRQLVETRAPRRWLKACLAMLALAGAGLGIALLAPRLARAPAAPIDLAVRRSGDVLRLTWDPRNAAVRKGNSGVLTVRDGTSQHTVELSAGQLRSGMLEYTPQAQMVEFRLRVLHDGTPLPGEASIFAIGTPPPVPSHTEAAPIDAPPPSEGVIPAAKEGRPPVSPAETPQAPGKARDLPLSLALAPLGTAARSPGSLPVLLPARSIAQDPPGPIAVPTVYSPPASAPVPAPRSPLVAKPPIGYSAPTAMLKITPSVPTGVRSMIREAASVEVRVSIDAEGKVTSAIPVSGSGSRQDLLRPVAVQAALLWRFEPARKNGHPVASETRVKFDFERPAR